MERIYNNYLFMNTFNFSTIGMAIVSTDRRWLKVNSSLCEILGYSSAELEKMTLQDITHPEDIELCHTKFNNMLRGEINNFEVEKRFIHKDGCIVWGLWSISLVKNNQNNPLYFILHLQNITEQKELQEKLKKSEESYRNLIQFSPEPMAIHNNGKLIYVNEAGVKLIGAKSCEELIGTYISDYIHPDNKLVLQHIQQTVTTNQYLKPDTIKLIDVNGKEIDVELSSVPIYYEGKKVIQVFFSDITQRKKMEETIRNNEAQYLSLIKHNPDAVFGIDLEGNFTLINESCTRITGYSKEELVGMSLHSVLIEEDIKKTRNVINRVIQGETGVIIGNIRKKNGDKAIVNITSVPIIIDEKIIGFYAVAKDVTEQKLIEQELKHIEERNRELVESSPNAIVVHQEGKIVYVNPKFTSLVKATSNKEIIGQQIIQFIHPDFQEIVKKRIELLERNIPVESLEEKYVLLDGSIKDVEVIATPIEYMAKPAFQAIIHDISKRKEMERELNKSQEQYRSVVENVKEIIFQTDKQGLWTFLNHAWEKITGFSIDESIGKRFHDYVHREDREQYVKQFQSLIQGKTDYLREEIRYVIKERGYCWAEVFARVALDDQGEIIGTLGTLNDITKRKESEEELKASEERFRLLAEYSSDMITMHDTKGIYLYASPASKEILQYDEEEIVGKKVYSFIHPEDKEIVKEHYQILLSTGYTISTYRIRRKDGKYVWFESAVKLLCENHPGEKKLIVVSRNINNRKLAEQKLHEAYKILKHLSTIDGLTGVSNRRTFDERLEMEWNCHNPNSVPLALIMFDIDYFKAFNDTYGHQAGDDCLKQIASKVQDTLGQSTDLLFRYGGEEFAVILPETDVAGANKVGEKIRTAIETLKIPHAGSNIAPWVTISVGTATIIPSVHTSFSDLISNADKALYKAKNDGRNCVRTYK